MDFNLVLISYSLDPRETMTVEDEVSFFPYGDVIPEGDYRLMFGLTEDRAGAEEFFAAAEFPIPN